MSTPVAIIAGEPNSISSEIIFKSWKLKKEYIHKPYFIIGSFKLLNLQIKKLKYKIKIKKINKNFKTSDLKGRELPFYDIDTSKIQLLGTGRWDDPKVRLEPTLIGGWFAGADRTASYEFFLVIIAFLIDVAEWVPSVIYLNL